MQKKKKAQFYVLFNISDRKRKGKKQTETSSHAP